jgi:hypothetical protein
MNSLKLLILLIVILFGIYLFQLRYQPHIANDHADQFPTPTLRPSVTPRVSIMMHETSSPTPSNTSYQYPGSTDQGNGTYITTDSVNTVTQWYKDAISKDGYNTTTVVQTSANGVIDNTLVAGKSGQQISVEIKKTANSDTVTITVSR